MHNDGIGITGTYRAVNEFDIDKYEREAKELVAKANRLRSQGKKVSYSDFTQEENARMKVYNATMRLNRLEYLKSQIGLTMVDLGLNVDNAMRDKIQADYMDEIKRQSGILGEDLTKTSLWTGKEVATVVMAQTGSANFSQRVWADTDALKAELDAVISTGIIRGDNPREMARLLKEHVRTVVTNHRYVTERLARTESARVQFVAQKNSLIEMDYRFCQWHAEPSACKICSDIYRHDTKWGRGVYEVDNVPTIPAHPNCRCGISAYWVDDADNSYKANHKGQSSEENVKIEEEVQAKPKPKKKLYNYINDTLTNYFTENFGAKGKTYVNEINETLNKAPEVVQKVWKKMGSKFDLKLERGTSYYYPADKAVYMDLKSFNATADPDYYQKKFDVFYHEFGHAIDDLAVERFGQASSYGRLAKLIDEDFEDYMTREFGEIKSDFKVSKYSPDKKNGYIDELGVWVKVKKDGTPTKRDVKRLTEYYELDRKRKTFSKIRKDIKDSGKYSMQDYGDISDMFSGLTNSRFSLGIGHEEDYWIPKGQYRQIFRTKEAKEMYRENNRSTEFFAEATSATINNPESLKLIKNYFPKTYDEYLKILEEVGSDE